VKQPEEQLQKPEKASNQRKGPAIPVPVPQSAGSSGVDWLEVVVGLVAGIFIVGGSIAIWTTDLIINFNGDNDTKIISATFVISAVIYLVIYIYLTLKKGKMYSDYYFLSVFITLMIVVFVHDLISEGYIAESFGQFILAVISGGLLSLMVSVPGIVILKICAKLSNRKKNNRR